MISVSYLPHYYSHDYHPFAGRILREIQKSGLERELIAVVLARAKTGPFSIRHPNQVAKDEWEANLLDDEALPVLDAIF